MGPPLEQTAMRRRSNFSSKQEAIRLLSTKLPFSRFGQEVIELYVEHGTKPSNTVLGETNPKVCRMTRVCGHVVNTCSENYAVEQASKQILFYIILRIAQIRTVSILILLEYLFDSGCFTCRWSVCRACLQQRERGHHLPLHGPSALPGM